MARLSDVLNNPAWFALRERQAHQGERNELAARFVPAISPLGAVRDNTPEALAALRRLCGLDGVMLLCEAGELPRHPFRLMRSVAVRQMVCDDVADAVEQDAVVLGSDDAPQMVSLVKLTEPGPFAARTVELGCYFGIRHGDQLVAMAGERLKPPGCVEISGVCTHPDGRGRGYAYALVVRLTRATLARGERAFLYVAVGSPSEKVATALYERVGYRFRREMYVHALMPA
jgi:ribosomal protein S18 acetylase RimI-like enzyme